MSRMRTLNAAAALTLAGLDDVPHAVTKVTGFGLLGHAWEMADRSGCTLEVDAAARPLYEGARGLAEAGVRTGGDPPTVHTFEGRVTSTAARRSKHSPTTRRPQAVCSRQWGLKTSTGS